MPNRIIVDGHVHIRSCYDTISFLNWACFNFRSTMENIGCGGEFTGVLFVVDSFGEYGLRRLKDILTSDRSPRAKKVGGWQLGSTREDVSYCLRSEDGEDLFIVSGRQIVSREQLEVLAIGTHRQFERRKSAKTLIHEISQADAIPIVPWGVGKWLGKRGQLVEELIRDPQLPPFFLGDTANRPTFWSLSVHFERAKDQGIKNLPGSDPLPFPGEAQKVGRYGFLLNGSLDVEKPAQDLRQRLLDSSTTLRRFGCKERPLRFVRNQLKMQYRKLI